MKIPKQITHTFLATLAFGAILLAVWQGFYSPKTPQQPAGKVAAAKITAVNDDGSLELEGLGMTVAIDNPRFTKMTPEQVKNWRSFATGRYIMSSEIHSATKTVKLPLNIFAAHCFKDPNINPKECPIRMDP